jgi:hypothetical protein
MRKVCDFAAFLDRSRIEYLIAAKHKFHLGDERTIAGVESFGSNRRVAGYDFLVAAVSTSRTFLYRSVAFGSFMLFTRAGSSNPLWRRVASMFEGGI